MMRFIAYFVVLLAPALALADLVISANENKLDLSSGERRIIADAPPDTVTILDFAVFPPRVRHLEGIRNSVLGPPSNVAIAPGERLALIASSFRVDPDDPARHVPDEIVHVLDLTADPPRVIDEVTVGRQPSGLSIDRGGKLALVANRADGTVSVLAIDGKYVKRIQTIQVCEPDGEPSHVAISPDGKLALVTINADHMVRVLRIGEDRVELTARKLPVYGMPYHCEIMPDGELGLVAGGGGLDGPDADAISVIDLTVDPIRTIDHVVIGTAPESFDISPDGKLVAAVVMDGSNLPANHPLRTEHGELVLLRRDGKKLTKIGQLLIGRIPEGVTFTPDGRHVVVQHHPARELAIFRVEEDRLVDTGRRIEVPGMPSGIRIAE